MRFLNSIRKSEILAILLCAASLGAQDSLHPGIFKGTWKGATGDGEVTMTLKPDSQGGLAAEVDLIIAGEAVICKVNSVKVDGEHLEMSYDFEVQGAKLRSESKGTLKGATIDGTYKTLAPDAGAEVDQGTWTVTARK